MKRLLTFAVGVLLLSGFAGLPSVQGTAPIWRAAKDQKSSMLRRAAAFSLGTTCNRPTPFRIRSTPSRVPTASCGTTPPTPSFR